MQWNSIFILSYIAPDTIDDEEQGTVDLTQSDIKSSVDLFSAQKRFDLELPLYGPYQIDYTRNGRWVFLRNNIQCIVCLVDIYY